VPDHLPKPFLARNGVGLDPEIETRRGKKIERWRRNGSD
jgi:ribosome-associated protein YbcJ (S4-like RNA binding protein)